MERMMWKVIDATNLEAFLELYQDVIIVSFLISLLVYCN